MTKKQKKTLKRIIAAAVLTVLLALLFHFVELPWFVRLVLWLVPYLVIGHDVLRKAFMGIKNGEVFDENFLMAVATVGAIGCGEYAEGVAVMLFYQIGELFQSYAPTARIWRPGTAASPSLTPMMCPLARPSSSSPVRRSRWTAWS